MRCSIRMICGTHIISRTLVEPFTRPRPTELGWTYSNLDRVDRDGSMLMRSFLTWVPTAHPKLSMVQCLEQDMFVVPSASLISRRAFQAVGGFDELLSGYEDDDFFLRMFRAGYDNVFIDTPLSKWRIYPTSSSYSSRMARSRRIYAEKLLRAYPDEPRDLKYYTTGVIAPRFLMQMLAEYPQSPCLRHPARGRARLWGPAIYRAISSPEMAVFRNDRASAALVPTCRAGSVLARWHHP